MPRMDGTGPMGEGPMTGRCAGFCADTSVRRGCMSRNYSFGRGKGFRRNFVNKDNFYDDKDYLIKRADMLELELKKVKELIEMK